MALAVLFYLYKGMIITLLTDLGMKDVTVSSAKAALQQVVADVGIVDISHYVSRHNWREAAYLLATVFGSFPEGTLHISPVSAFSDRHPRMILAEKKGHYFIAPDNGLLPVALGNDAMDHAMLCHQYVKPFNLISWFRDAGRVAQALAKSGAAGDPASSLLMGRVGERPEGFTINLPPPLPPPQVTPISIVCRILYADRYNNLVVNITREEFDAIVKDGRPFRIRTFKGVNITSVSNHYNEVPEGSPLCRFNKTGYLEIAVNHGSAMELFGIDPTDATALDYHSIRISI